MIKRLAVNNRTILRIALRGIKTGSENTDYKDDFNQEDKKDEKASRSRFTAQYKKPSFLEDEYDHLKKSESAATI